jgi:hypothetical protein
MEGFRLVKGKLIPPLSAVFREPKDDFAAERTLATSLLTDYTAGQPDVLADLLADAYPKPYAVLFPTALPLKRARRKLASRRRLC